MIASYIAIHVVLYTSSMVQIRRICLTIKNFLECICDHFLYSHDLNVYFRGDTVGRKEMLMGVRKGVANPKV